MQSNDSIYSLSSLELGGPTLTAESIATADAEKKMNGSVIIVSAKSIEEVHDVVNSDPYWVGDVVRTSYRTAESEITITHKSP